MGNENRLDSKRRSIREGAIHLFLTIKLGYTLSFFSTYYFLFFSERVPGVSPQKKKESAVKPTP
jgi:hypothetical protein